MELLGVDWKPLIMIDNAGSYDLWKKNNVNLIRNLSFFFFYNLFPSSHYEFNNEGVFDLHSLNTIC